MGPPSEASSVRRTYENPPLIEALVEFHFPAHGPWDSTIPGLLYEKVRHDFPTKRTMTQKMVEIQVHDQQIRHKVNQTERSQFARRDESALVQVGPYLLVANHLRPYTKWEHLRDITDRALATYFEIETPKRVERVVLQYINQVEFDSAKFDLEDYFEYYPRVSDALARDYGAFFVGIHIPYQDPPAVLVVEMTPGNPDPEARRLPIMLTLTYQNVQPLPADKGKLMEWLESGHTRVNDAFEACIKDKLREKFGVR